MNFWNDLKYRLRTASQKENPYNNLNMQEHTPEQEAEANKISPMRPMNTENLFGKGIFNVVETPKVGPSFGNHPWAPGQQSLVTHWNKQNQAWAAKAKTVPPSPMWHNVLQTQMPRHKYNQALWSAHALGVPEHELFEENNTNKQL